MNTQNYIISRWKIEKTKYVNLINGAMGLDQLEQGVSQHHSVDQSRSPLTPARHSGGGDADDDDGGGGGGGGGGGEMGWSQILGQLLRFFYF